MNVVRQTRFTEEQDGSKQKGKTENDGTPALLSVRVNPKCCQEVDCEDQKIVEEKLRNPLAKVTEKENLKIESNRRKSK